MGGVCSQKNSTALDVGEKQRKSTRIVKKGQVNDQQMQNQQSQDQLEVIEPVHNGQTLE